MIKLLCIHFQLMANLGSSREKWTEKEVGIVGKKIEMSGMVYTKY